MAFKKGNIPYNKGKKTNPSEISRMIETVKKQFLNGRIVWNKGKKTGLVPRSAFKKGHNAPSTAFKANQKSWNTGIHYLSITGENNPNWKGGISSENSKLRNSLEMKLWRDSVFARDGYTCQKTGQIGGDMECHHVLNFAEYPELRFAIDNGITLSKKSHKEFHKKYGMKNNTREQLEEYLAIVEA